LAELLIRLKAFGKSSSYFQNLEGTQTENAGNSFCKRDEVNKLPAVAGMRKQNIAGNRKILHCKSRKSKKLMES
jgi:hypothetical protein